MPRYNNKTPAALTNTELRELLPAPFVGNPSDIHSFHEWMNDEDRKRYLRAKLTNDCRSNRTHCHTD